MAFELHFPSSLPEAWDLLARGPPGSTMPIAGGTDLLLAMEFRRFAPTHVVSLARLPLNGLRWHAQGVRIGSTTPLRDIELDPQVTAKLPALAESLTEVGSVQLRHRATLGGNIARAAPASDLLPALVALGAEAEISSRDGRRTVAVATLLQGSWRTTLAPGELVESVLVPAPRRGTYRWQRVRPSNDISQVGLAVVLHPPSADAGPWRLVAGGTLPTVQRLERAERLLGSAAPDDATIARAARLASEEAAFGTDLRAAEAYRRHLLRVMVGRALRDVARGRARPAAEGPSRRPGGEDV